MMLERGIQVAPSTICRWVQRCIPEFEKRWDRCSRRVGTSWRVDETFANIKGNWHYLYRAVDRQGMGFREPQVLQDVGLGLVYQCADLWSR